MVKYSLWLKCSLKQKRTTTWSPWVRVHLGVGVAPVEDTWARYLAHPVSSVRGGGGQVQGTLPRAPDHTVASILCLQYYRKPSYAVGPTLPQPILTLPTPSTAPPTYLKCHCFYCIPYPAHSVLHHEFNVPSWNIWNIPNF